jgi:tetratricopeptide (TPR) repeat protein
MMATNSAKIWTALMWPCALIAMTGFLLFPVSAFAFKDSEDARIEKAQNSVLEGRQALKEGRWMDGIWAYERAYSLFPQNEYLFTIASAYEKVPGRCSDAVSTWQRFLAVCGDCADVKAAKLRLAQAQGNCKSGAAAAIPPAAPNTDAAEAKRLVDAGQFIEAIAIYERMYRVEANPLRLFSIADVYSRMPGRCADAALGWERFLSACPTCPERQKGLERQQATRNECGQPAAAGLAGAAAPAAQSPSAPAASASKAWYQNVWLWVGVAATTVVVLFASGVFSGPDPVGAPSMDDQSASGGVNVADEASMGGSTP